MLAIDELFNILMIVVLKVANFFFIIHLSVSVDYEVWDTTHHTVMAVVPKYPGGSQISCRQVQDKWELFQNILGFLVPIKPGSKIFYNTGLFIPVKVFLRFLACLKKYHFFKLNPMH